MNVARAVGGGGEAGGLGTGQGGEGSGGGDKKRKRAEEVKVLTLRLLVCNLPAKAASRVLLPDPGGPSRRVMRPGGMIALTSSRMLKCLVEDCTSLTFWNKPCTSFLSAVCGAS